MNKSDASETLQGVATFQQTVSFLAVYKYVHSLQ
jgi:hypothetical protein